MKFCLSLHHNVDKKFLFVNGVKIYQFRAKDSEINTYSLSLRNILKDFTVDNVKKTGLDGYVYNFSIGYNSIDAGYIVFVSLYT